MYLPIYHLFSLWHSRALHKEGKQSGIKLHFQLVFFVVVVVLNHIAYSPLMLGKAFSICVIVIMMLTLTELMVAQHKHYTCITLLRPH